MRGRWLDTAACMPGRLRGQALRAPSHPRAPSAPARPPCPSCSAAMVGFGSLVLLEAVKGAALF